jgi:hypothetical protein
MYHNEKNHCMGHTMVFCLLLRRSWLRKIGSSTPPTSSDKRYQEQYNENEKQNLGNRSGARSNAKEAKRSRNNSYNEENHRPP